MATILIGSTVYTPQMTKKSAASLARRQSTMNRTFTCTECEERVDAIVRGDVIEHFQLDCTGNLMAALIKKG